MIFCLLLGLACKAKTFNSITMKQLILFGAFFILTNVSRAQTNYLQEGTQWSVSSTYVDGQSCVWHEEILYSVQGDTLLNGSTYKKLLFKKEKQNISFNPNCGFGGFSTGLETLLRQNGKSLFSYKPLVGVTESLLYNFDLSVGDSVFDLYHLSFAGKVIAIDSISINGLNKARFWTDSTSTLNANFMIEGVGHNLGFLEPMILCIGCSSSLNCFKQDALIETITQGQACNFDLSLPDFQSNTFKAFPNPFTESVSIQFSTQKNARINVYTITGALVKTIQASGNTSINTSSFPSGVYILAIVMETEIAYIRLLKTDG